jgi:probable rRNA maturation factor
MNLEISIEYDQWNVIDLKNVVNKGVQAVFSEVGVRNNKIEICFLFTNDDELRILNKTYRGFDKSTNVLSFPMTPIDEETDKNIHVLGSIAFAYQTIRREADEQGKSFENHLAHLIVHGVLHLLGYDHVNSLKADIMESTEIKILKEMDISSPYWY